MLTTSDFGSSRTGLGRVQPTLAIWEQLGFTRCVNGYWWKELTSIDSPIEVVLIVWPPGSSSRAHEHGLSWNLTSLLPLGRQPQLQAIYHRCHNDRLKLERSAVLQVGGFHVVLPYQIHEVINNSEETVVSLHCYFPRRA
jgi:predicted metal-dependent enzyme (double-stranded beta helix superfamily)